MRKTMEQIVLEGQAQKCSSMEELFLLWQLMQQMEEDPMGNTCHPGIDPIAIGRALVNDIKTGAGDRENEEGGLSGGRHNSGLKRK